MALSAFTGKFSAVALSTVEALIEESGLPDSLKSWLPMEEDPDGAKSGVCILHVPLPCVVMSLSSL